MEGKSPLSGFTLHLLRFITPTIQGTNEAPSVCPSPYFVFMQKEKGEIPGVADADNARTHISWSGAMKVGTAKQAEAPVSY